MSETDNRIHKGKIVSWNAERGFGFAKTEAYPNVFVHVFTICQHLDGLAFEKKLVSVAFGVRPNHTASVGAEVYIYVEQGEKGPKSKVAVCRECMAVSMKVTMIEAAIRKLLDLFKDGHRFSINGVPWFYKAGMPKAARSAGIEAFEKAAMDAIVRGAPREEIIAQAEDAAKKVWIAERDGR